MDTRSKKTKTEPAPTPSSTPRRYEILRDEKGNPRRLGEPGSQGTAFVGRRSDGAKEVAVKVFHQGEQSSAPKEAVLRPLERPLLMRHMPRPS